VTKKLGGHLGLPLTFFSKLTASKFWDSYSVHFRQKPNNYVFEDDLVPSSSRRGAASFILWSLLTYSNGYYEVYERFQGGRFRVGVGIGRSEGIIREGFSKEDFSWGKFFLHGRISMKGVQDFIVLFKKNEKINIYFFQVEVMSSIKT